MFENWREPRNHEDPSRHHGGGVNKRGNRRWPLHRIRQPGVQEKLRRLTHRANKEQEGCQFERVHIHAKDMDDFTLKPRNRSENFIEGERLGELENQKNTQGETKIANAVHNESLHRRSIC